MNSPTDITVKPRIMPRDSTDCLLGVFVGLLLVTVLFGIPALVAYIITKSTLAAFLTFCVFYALFACFAVTRLTLSPTGIQFHRLFGSPRFLPWDRIVSIAVAPRSELVLRGWLWPPFPAREMTASLSAREHLRITWQDGYCYFPPAGPEEVLAYAAERIPPNVT
jgi:hypothetical protein